LLITNRRSGRWRIGTRWSTSVASVTPVQCVCISQSALLASFIFRSLSHLLSYPRWRALPRSRSRCRLCFEQRPPRSSSAPQPGELHGFLRAEGIGRPPLDTMCAASRLSGSLDYEIRSPSIDNTGLNHSSTDKTRFGVVGRRRSSGYFAKPECRRWATRPSHVGSVGVG
jgi:hypothetical protein